MADTQVTFDIVARDRASRDFKRVGTAADRAGDRFRRFSAISTRTAKAAGVALGGAIVAVTGGLYKAAKAAGEEEQEMAILANTLRRSTGATDDQVDATERWITSVQNATGVADGELRPALGKLAIATGDVSRAQDILNVALDISAARGLSLNTVVTALGKGAQGSVSGLARLGIATKDAAGETLSFDQVLQNAAKTMGGAAAAAADTTAGRVRIMRARFADLVEEIGTKVLPIANRFLSFLLDDLIPALGEAKRWFQSEVLPALRRVAEYVRDVMIPRLRDLAADLLPQLNSSIRDVRASLNQLRAMFTVTTAAGDDFTDGMSTMQVVAKYLAILIKQATINIRVLSTAIRFATSNLRFLAAQAGRVLDLIGQLRDALGSLPRLSLPDIPTPGGLHIPGFADGGTMTRSGLAVVGERGPELAYLPRGTRVFSNTESQRLGGGVSVTQYVTTADPQRAADEAVRGVRRVAWSAGWAVA